jgi:hypothetical protein
MLNSKYQIVNSKSAIFPITKQIAHPANPPRTGLNSKSEIVNSKSAIFPITKQIAHPANPPRTGLNSKSEIVKLVLSEAEWIVNRPSSVLGEDPLQIAPFFVQTNPILSAFYPPSVWRAGGFQTLYLTKAYEKNAKFCPPETNPNEPKRTQNEPNFSLVRAPQSQNEPKRTQFIAA